MPREKESNRGKKGNWKNEIMASIFAFLIIKAMYHIDSKHGIQSDGC